MTIPPYQPTPLPISIPIPGQQWAPLGQRLGAATTPKEAARAILSSCDQLFQWDAAYLVLCSLETGLFYHVIDIDTVEGTRCEFPAAHYTLSKSSLGYKALTEGPQLVLQKAPEDWKKQGLQPFGKDEQPSMSMMFVPFRRGGVSFGVLTVQSYELHAYSERELEKLQALADFAAGALDRTFSEMKLREQERLTREFASLGQTLSAAHTPYEAALVIVESAQRLFHWDASFVNTYDAESDLMTPLLAYDLLGGERVSVPLSSDNPLRPTPLGRRVIEEGVLLLSRAEKEAQFSKDSLHRYGDRDRASETFVFAPIRTGTRCVGILSIQSYKKDAFRAEQLNDFQALADHCGGALARTMAEIQLQQSAERAREELEFRVAERTREQQESLSLLLASLEATADALLIVSTEGVVYMCNGNARRMWHLSHLPEEEKTNQRLEEIILPFVQDPRHFLDVLQEVARTPHSEAHLTLFLNDQRIVEVYGRPCQIGTEARGRVWSFRDITEQRGAAEALRQSETVYRKAIEAASGVPYFLRFDKDEYDFIGEGLGLLLGFPSGEVDRKTFKALIKDYDIRQFGVTGTIEQYARQYKQGHVPVFRADLLLRTADMGEKWMQDCALPIYREGEDEPYASLGILLDITHRKEAEFAAQEESAYQRRGLETENRLLKRQLLFRDLEHPEAFASIVTANEGMRILFHYVESIAYTGAPVLITGETGVGKELLARAIHRVSGRQGPFIPVNIAGLDDEIFSDTLFGHRRGAFTGALTDRRGLVEAASNGTLFLDEIGDLALSSQIKLLRLLQEQEYYPLGSDTARRGNTTFVLATNQHLEEIIEQGIFRKDLYYRLQTHKVEIPPLRERKEDIPVLVRYFLERAAERLGKKVPTPPPQLFPLLASYHFPGNVRELESMVFDALSKHQSKMLSLNVFRSRIEQSRQASKAGGKGTLPRPVEHIVFGETLPTIQEGVQRLIEEALRRMDNNQSQAARLLGISQQALNRRLRDQVKKRERPSS